MKHEAEIEVNGTKIMVRVKQIATRFGIRWIAENNYGEPKTNARSYTTGNRAFNAELVELMALFR